MKIFIAIGKLIIDFFSTEDLETLLAQVAKRVSLKTEPDMISASPTEVTPETQATTPHATPNEDDFSLEHFSI